MQQRIQVPNTKYGDISAYAISLDNGGYSAYVSGTEYPELAGVQAPTGNEPAADVPAVVEALRRAINAH